MTRIDEDNIYNIEDLIKGKWYLRYRNWMTLVEAEEKYEWLTTSEYWLKKASDYRIVKLHAVIDEVKRYRS